MEATKTDMAAEYDRASEVKAFDETKAGVKGLVDAGVSQIPRIFYSPPEERYLKESSADQTKFSIPVIDLGGLSDDSIRRMKMLRRFEKHPKLGVFFKLSTMESLWLLWRRLRMV